jgi:hypothetical protein
MTMLIIMTGSQAEPTTTGHQNYPRTCTGVSCLLGQFFMKQFWQTLLQSSEENLPGETCPTGSTPSSHTCTAHPSDLPIPLWWSSDKEHLKPWQNGKTGYSLVDAAVRQIWRIGWTNNFMRHVVACFLVAYLRTNWVEGLQWFSDTLLDFDVAISSMMWQKAGMSCGFGKGSNKLG